MHHILCESPFIARDLYAIRPLMFWHLLGSYFLLIWGVGVVKIFFSGRCTFLQLIAAIPRNCRKPFPPPPRGPCETSRIYVLRQKLTPGLPAVSWQFLTRSYPHPICLLKCLPGPPKCLSPLREGCNASQITPAMRVIARQLRDKAIV